MDACGYGMDDWVAVSFQYPRNAAVEKPRDSYQNVSSASSSFGRPGYEPLKAPTLAAGMNDLES